MEHIQQIPNFEAIILMLFQLHIAIYFWSYCVYHRFRPAQLGMVIYFGLKQIFANEPAAPKSVAHFKSDPKITETLCISVNSTWV